MVKILQFQCKSCTTWAIKSTSNFSYLPFKQTVTENEEKQKHNKVQENAVYYPQEQHHKAIDKENKTTDTQQTTIAAIKQHTQSKSPSLMSLLALCHHHTTHNAPLRTPTNHIRRHFKISQSNRPTQANRPIKSLDRM